MPSEAKRAAIRILSNYARLFSTVFIGLWMVRLLLPSLGKEGYGLITLMGSTVGIAAMFQMIIQTCLIRELGSAYHKGEEVFRRTYNSAFYVTLSYGLVAVAIFGILIALVPWLNIPGPRPPVTVILPGTGTAYSAQPVNFHNAARLFMAGKAVEVFVVILLAPTRNMLVIKEEMIKHNIRRIIDRLAYFLPAVWIALQGRPAPQDVPQAVVWYGWSSMALYIGVIIFICASLMRSDKRLRPNMAFADRGTAWEVFKGGGWNIVIQLCNNMQLRAAAVVMNLFFGLASNASFGLAMTLASYVRMLTTGMSEGLDAVTARLTTGDKHQQFRNMVRHSTRLHAFVAFPAGCAVFMLASPFMHAWVSNRAGTPLEALPPAARVMQILTIGSTIRAIFDGWNRILYGAGQIKAYVREAVLTGLLIPALGVALAYALPHTDVYHLPKGAPVPWICAFNGPAIAYSGVLVLIGSILLPRVASRVLEIPYREIVWPAVPSAAMAILASPVMLLANWYIPPDRWGFIMLFGVGGAYGVVYLGLSLMFTITREERDRVSRGILNRLTGKGGNGGRGGRRRKRFERPPEEDSKEAQNGQTNTAFKESAADEA